MGFSDEILDIAYLGRKESHIAVATNSCDIKVYKSENMACQLLQGHSDIVVALSTSPANRSVLVSGSKVQYIPLKFGCCLWNLMLFSVFSPKELY